MVWAAALIFLAGAEQAGYELKAEQVIWLMENAKQGWDVYEDGIWVSSETDHAGSKFAMRLEDLMTARTSDYRTVWMRGDHRKDKTRAYRTSKFRITFNCATMTSSNGAWVNYRADGSVHSNGQGSAFRYEDLIPGSIGERWAKFACTQK